MIRHFFQVLVCISLFAIVLPSCVVSKKKYLQATARANRESSENDKLRKELNAERDKNSRLNGANGDLTSANNSQKKQLDNANSRIAQLTDSLNDAQATIADLTNRIDALGSENSKTRNAMSSELEAQRKRLQQLQEMIDQQKRATEALHKRIADALNGFNSSELTVTMKNGKVYISMQEGLLFPSGSAVVNPKGKVALSKVASVLNTNKDINIDIEGHTDSIPIHSVKYEDNWALSTARAVSIAHVLIDDYKVTPAKLSASGRSEYDPVATNATPAGRAQNRRTEIILEPKLDELMGLINGK